MGNNCANAAKTVNIGETAKNRFSGSAEWNFLHNQEWLNMVANLPHDLPPYSTVYFYFQRWTKTGAERTFAWIGKYRRLSKEYEFYEHTSESSIYLALIRKMLRNLTAVNS